MAIGLVGTNCAGKGEVASLLKTLGFQYVSLSDELREEMQSRGIEVNRDNLIKFGRELRAEQGDDILAQRAKTKVNKSHDFIVDSIRNPAEAKCLQALENFVLVSVDADPKIRFTRMQQRNREGDPRSFEDFIALEAKESDASSSTAQQVNQTAKFADATLLNNGSMVELKKAVNELLKRIRK